MKRKVWKIFLRKLEILIISYYFWNAFLFLMYQKFIIHRSYNEKPVILTGTFFIFGFGRINTDRTIIKLSWRSYFLGLAHLADNIWKISRKILCRDIIYILKTLKKSNMVLWQFWRISGKKIFFGLFVWT